MKDAAAKIRRLEEICRERGVPFTEQRRAVLEELLGCSDHPTADQLFLLLREKSPRIGRRTVYRILETLIEWGLIRRVHHPGAAVRFDAKTFRHHHLVCTRCQKIVDLQSIDLDSIALPRKDLHGFSIEDFSVQLMGLCRGCGKTNS